MPVENQFRRRIAAEEGVDPLCHCVHLTRQFAGVDCETSVVVAGDDVAYADLATSIWDKASASNANESLSCLCTLFVLTNLIGMSDSDLSPRSDVERSTA